MAKAPICDGCGNPKTACTCLEDALAFQLRAAEIGGFVREYPFARPRKWRADFAWPDLMLMVELEGGTFSGGRHVRPYGFARDCDKYNAATLLGWRVFRFTGAHVKDGTALQTIEAALGAHAVTIERKGERVYIKPGGD